MYTLGAKASPTLRIASRHGSRGHCRKTRIYINEGLALTRNAIPGLRDPVPALRTAPGAVAAGKPQSKPYSSPFHVNDSNVYIGSKKRKQISDRPDTENRFFSRVSPGLRFVFLRRVFSRRPAANLIYLTKKRTSSY